MSSVPSLAVPGIQLLEGLKAGLRQEIQRYFYEISQVVPYTLKDASQLQL